MCHVIFVHGHVVQIHPIGTENVFKDITNTHSSVLSTLDLDVLNAWVQNVLSTGSHMYIDTFVRYDRRN